MRKKEEKKGKGPVIPPPLRPPWRRVLLWAGIAAGVVSGAAIAAGAWWYHLYISRPESALVAEVMVMIEPGMTFRSAAERLSKEGVISHPRAFLMLGRAKDVTRRIQAGNYTFKPGMTPVQILDLITRGDVTVWNFTVREGWTIFDIARQLENLGPWSAERFLGLTQDERRARDLGIPAASLEGYLFPATYPLHLSMIEEEILTAMLERGLTEKTEERLARAQELQRSWHEILTLASMIEKEAMVKEEMPLIARVFYNRLSRGMKLQSDPTAVYGLPDFRPPVKKEHLQRDSPYNTYLYAGLPPGPICNPGAAAIEAALSPADNDYLYFAATGGGRHAFTSDYNEHIRNINKYLRKKGGSEPKEVGGGGNGG